MRLAQQAGEQGNSNAITDAWSAAALAHAAISCAGANVRINLAALSEDPEAGKIQTRLEKVDREAGDLLKTIRKNIKDRAGIDLL
jgi:glutamate formiminotransferase/formiminotetrahydrofolate cyclodeaminase